jgi:hypothetical protein
MNGQDEDASHINGTSSSPDKELELASSGSRSVSGSVPLASPMTRTGSPQSAIKPDHHDGVMKDPSSSPTPSPSHGLSCTCVYDGVEDSTATMPLAFFLDGDIFGTGKRPVQREIEMDGCVRLVFVEE